MSVPVELPELGESVVEGTVARWLVKEGDRVELDQPLVEVTTDKVDAEIPAPSQGVIEAILVAEGETIAVGTVLARINPAAEAGATPPRATEEAPAVASPRPPAAAAPPPQSSADPRPTPVAAQMANESGVDLTGMAGSGVGGRITKH
ncbi:MAG: dihydrolipoamide succinyltransferase, partial [Myxococcales bacterium]|nr:dihydrolipoamide succinyltransferase [Myxococcales bacterium]